MINNESVLVRELIAKIKKEEREMGTWKTKQEYGVASIESLLGELRRVKGGTMQAVRNAVIQWGGDYEWVEDENEANEMMGEDQWKIFSSAVSWNPFNQIYAFESFAVINTHAISDNWYGFLLIGDYGYEEEDGVDAPDLPIPQ